jgi:Protein of unknown function (DUF3102)
MSNDIIAPLEGSNFLIDIAARIQVEHQAVAASLKRSIERAIAAGELLIEAKEQIPHGDWLPWLQEHCGVTPRSAQGYIRLARNRDKIELMRNGCAFLGVKEALNCLAAPAIAFDAIESEEARTAAIEDATNGTNVRTAVRRARKLDHEVRYSRSEPLKPLEGTYRIILADPPWQ